MRPFLQKKTILLVLLSSCCLCLIGFLLFPFGQEAFQILSRIINTNTHPAWLIGLYLILPVFGFPITLFLILFGVKFGALAGSLLTFAGLPFHLIVSYLLVHSIFRPVIQKIATKLGFSVPQVPADKQAWFSFLFMLFPGLPYTVKNYLLALSGVPFAMYFFFAWLINGLMGIPIVILGDAATDLNLLLLGLAVLVVIAISFGRTWLKKRVQL